MSRKYNISKRSDVRRLARDLERSVRKELRREIPRSGIEQPCPECGSTMRMIEGVNTCPRCGKTIEVSFDLSRL